MLRRKPSKIEVRVEDDKHEIEEARRNVAVSAVTTTTGAVSLLHHFDNKEPSNNPPSKSQRIEVEVKLRLPNSVAHQSVLSLLSPFHVVTHCQQNNFVDGASGELSAKRAILRLRFYGEDSRCVLSLKAKAVISNGVSRVEEDEEDIDPIIGRECVSNPNKLREIESRIMKRVSEEFNVNEGGFVCLGGFRNVRGVHKWKGLTLEIDETMFDFGTCYEIECESYGPDKAKELIEGFLKENGIAYSYSVVSKFAIFRSGKIPKLMAE